MNSSESKNAVDLNEAKEQVRKVCKRLALLHLSYAKVIIDELGEVEGKNLVLKAIKDYGIRIGENVKETVHAKGSNNDPENYTEDLPSYGMHDKMEKVNLNNEEYIRAYGCVMGKYWKELGENEIGRYYCYVDPAKYMAFNPDFKLIHTKTIPDGDEYCEFKIKHTTEQERDDFFKKDKDWSYIDK